MLIIASSSACVIALTWGGVQYPWGSARVIVPLIVGLAGMGAFLAYEAKVAKEPMVSITLKSLVYHREISSHALYPPLYSTDLLPISSFLAVDKPDELERGR